MRISDANVAARSMGLMITEHKIISNNANNMETINGRIHPIGSTSEIFLVYAAIIGYVANRNG